MLRDALTTPSPPPRPSPLSSAASSSSVSWPDSAVGNWRRQDGLVVLLDCAVAARVEDAGAAEERLT